MESIIIEVAQGMYNSAKEAKNAGHIPIAYYGKGVETTHFTTEYQDFRRAYIKAGKSSIITLKDGKDEYAAIVHELQYDPVSDKFIHIDFMAIKKGQKMTTDVPLIFIGESPAVREENGVMMTSKDTLHIECLPKDLPHEIEVDISGLVDFQTTITVADLKVPSTVTVLDAEDIGIVTVSAPREEEVDEVVAPEAGAEGEEKKEGEAAEGEEKKEGEAASE